jgi:hypothetical protein
VSATADAAHAPVARREADSPAGADHDYLAADVLEYPADVVGVKAGFRPVDRGDDHRVEMLVGDELEQGVSQRATPLDP